MTDGDEKTNSNDPSDPSDPAEIARRFADLWQAQLSAMAADPALAHTMAETMRVWQGAAGPAMMGSAPIGGDPFQGMMSTWMSALSNGLAGTMGSGTEPKHGSTGTGGDTGTKTGTKASAGSSDGGERLLRDIDRRLAGIEDRLHRLESAAPSGSGDPEPGGTPPKRKSAAGKRAAARKPG